MRYVKAGLCLMLMLLLMGCGSKATMDTTEKTNEGYVKENDSKAHEISESEDKTSQSAEVPTADDISTNDFAGSELVDIDKKYEPKAEVVNAPLNQPVIQIGDTVLFLGEATVRDFINAGCQFFYDDTDVEREMARISASDKGTPSVYLKDASKSYGIEISFVMSGLGVETPIGDTVITEIQVIYWDTRGTDYNPYNHPENTPDFYSVYFNGGVRFSGSIAEATSLLGTPIKEEDSEYGVEGAVVHYVKFSDNCSLRGVKDKICQYTYTE